MSEKKSGLSKEAARHREASVRLAKELREAGRAYDRMAKAAHEAADALLALKKTKETSDG